MDSSPARKVDAASDRDGEREVLPKKEMEGVEPEEGVLLDVVVMVSMQ